MFTKGKSWASTSHSPCCHRDDQNQGAHQLGMSCARLAMTVTEELTRNGGRYGFATMCVGVGQGISLLLERV